MEGRIKREAISAWKDSEGDEWSVVVQHDCFEQGGPFLVSLWIESEDGSALATPTPDQAREMATALNVYADEAEKATAQIA